MTQWVLGGIVSAGVGIYLLLQYFTGVPAQSQLTTVTGAISDARVEERRTRRSSSNVLVLRIDNQQAVYRDRFPHFERIVGSIKVGDQVTALMNVGKSNYIWQLERGGEKLVSYDEVAEAERSNSFWNAMFGLLFLVVGLGTLGVMAFQWKNRPASPKRAEKADDED